MTNGEAITFRFDNLKVSASCVATAGRGMGVEEVSQLPNFLTFPYFAVLSFFVQIVRHSLNRCERAERYAIRLPCASSSSARIKQSDGRSAGVHAFSGCWRRAQRWIRPRPTARRSPSPRRRATTSARRYCGPRARRTCAELAF